MKGKDSESQCESESESFQYSLFISSTKAKFL